MEEIREIIRDRMVEDMNRAADKAKWWGYGKRPADDKIQSDLREETEPVYQ